MSTTTNLQLEKPDKNDYYDIQVQNNNMDKIDTAINNLSTTKAEKTAVEELKKSVSDGKTLVANAITGKGVTTATDATYQTMATNISAIKTSATLQSKTATLSTTAQTIKADSGYDGLSQVTVPAVSGTATVGNVLKGKTFASASGVSLTGTMVDNGAVSQTLTPGGSYTIPSGYHNGSGKITADTLANQTAGTASAAQILSGKTAWVNGAKVTGTIPDATGQYFVNNGMTMGSNLDVLPAKGYYNGSNAYVALKTSELASALGITANKILTGNTICGVSGTVTASKYATGTVDASSAITNKYVYYWNWGGTYNGSSTGYYTFNVTGLAFRPKSVKITLSYGGPARTAYGYITDECKAMVWHDQTTIYGMSSYFNMEYSEVLIKDNGFNFYMNSYIINSITWEAWG